MKLFYLDVLFVFLIPIVLCLLFVFMVELRYYNRPTLKFHNDEIDVSKVEFEYKNILKEN